MHLEFMHLDFILVWHSSHIAQLLCGSLSVGFVEAKVLPNAFIRSVLVGSCSQPCFVSLLFSCVLPIKLCLALETLFCLLYLTETLDNWFLDIYEWIQNCPHPNHGASKNRFFSPCSCCMQRLLEKKNTEQNWKKAQSIIIFLRFLCLHMDINRQALM